MPQFEDLPQVLLHNPRQNIPSRLSPSVVSVLQQASCASSSSLGEAHAVAYDHLVFPFYGRVQDFSILTRPNILKHLHHPMLYSVAFLKSSSLSQVKHIHNIHHLLFQCQDPFQWCVCSPHLNTRYSVEVQWHASSASPSIQCQAQLVVIDHSMFHCVTCFSQMCPRLLKKEKKRKRKKKSLFKGWSVQFSHSFMSNSLLSHEPQQARPPCPSSSPMGNPNPCPLSRWYHPSISSSEVPFSSCPQSFPATRCFQMSQLFTSGGQSIGVSASTSVLAMNTKDWFPLGWTGWIS